MNRQQWNQMATDKTSKIVGGNVEVVLLNDSISIYAENKTAHDLAVDHWKAAGCSVIQELYYKADEDLPEGWTTELSIP